MDDGFDPHFVDYLARSLGLSEEVCRRVVLEVLSQYDETLEDFVLRRHKELKRQEGSRNEEIYSRLLAEARARRFSASTSGLSPT